MGTNWSSTPQPMRPASLLSKNGTIAELYIERSRVKGIVGNIYKGRVIRVLPGMQAAFVDIGLKRPPFSTWRMFSRH